MRFAKQKWPTLPFSIASCKASKSVIQSIAKLGSTTSLLLKTITIGKRVLYNILQAYNILDMKVTGDMQRGVSTMYNIHEGKDDATDSVITAPEADHVKISICPGVSHST